MKRATLLPSSGTTTSSSRAGHLVCPACESGELQPQQQAHGLAASCALCGCLFSGAVLKVLEPEFYRPITASLYSSYWVSISLLVVCYLQF
jgi:hypothetical protein